MPTRKKHDRPLARVHKASGRARVRIGGRQFWIGKAGSKEAATNYELLITAWEAHDRSLPRDFEWPPGGKQRADAPLLDIEIPESPGMITVGHLLVKHLGKIRGNLTPKELRKKARWWVARSAANALESRVNVPADRFGPRMLKEVVAELVETPIKAKRRGEIVHRTKSQVRKVVAEIRRIFEAAVVDELIGPERLVALNALTELDLEGCRPSDKRKPVPAEDLKATLAVLPPVIADLFRFMDATAARPSEVCRLIPAEIFTDRDGNRIWRPRHHKTEEHTDRLIPLGPIARSLVDRWAAGKSPEDPIFTVKDIDRLRTDQMISFRRRDLPEDAFDQAALRRIVLRACRAAGVPRWSPYQIRHGGLTRYRRETGLDGAQRIGGHARASTTEGYAEPDLRAAIEAAERAG